MLEDLMDITIWGNPLPAYLTGALALAVALLAITVLRGVILHRLWALAQKTETIIDDLLALTAETVFRLLYLAAFYIAVKGLTLHPKVEKGVDTAGVIVLTILAIMLGIKLLAYWVEDYRMRKGADAAAKQNLIRLMPVLKVVIWGVGVVFLLDNLGFEISAVLAGLGIGGIAVALAAQAVLGDLFSYFAILFDRPFEIGDFIIEGEYMGTVEHIGIKTTRIRSLGGEQLVFSNTDLTSSRLRNYKRMDRRRVVFRLGVVYQTKAGTMKEIPGIIRGIIQSLEDTEFDRAHFLSFGDFNLIIEVVYYVLSRDYNVYMDIQQGINLKIMEEFEKRGIEFAYPTQTLFVSGVGADSSSEGA